MSPESDDEHQLADIGRQLPALDVDATSAEQIARRARADLGRRPPRRRLVEAVLVALVVTSFLTWAIIKVLAAYR